MTSSVSLALWVALAYLVGAIPIGLLIARAKGVDLREVGSKNIGATNVGRVLGSKLGVVVFVLDAFKATLPVLLASREWALGNEPTSLALVGFAAVLGHVFPVYLGFRGGKGVACSVGVFVAIDPAAALAAMVVYGQGLWLTRTSAVGSLTAVTSITLALWIADRPVAYQLLAFAIATLIWVRHIDNVRSLIAEAKARKQTKA